jgi:hypothetical protein
MMEEFDAFGRCGRQEPTKEWNDETTGVVGRKGVGGSGEDHGGPEKSRPPGTEPRGNKRFGRHAVADLVQVRSGARVAPGFRGGQ